MISGWQTSIESADLADWVTVAAYLLTAVLSARAAIRAGHLDKTRERTFWLITTLTLVLLGINEFLDLQTFLTSFGRAHARANNWYERRRAVQYAFVMVLGATAALAGIALLWLTRGAHIAVRLAQVGLTFIVAFGLIRAASFHHVDQVFGGTISGFTLSSLQEIAGILIIAAAALSYSRGR